MDISGIAATASKRTTLAAQTTADSKAKESGGTESIGLAFKKTDKRLQQQRDITSVQISALGQTKSAFSELQAASRALNDPAKSPSNAEMKESTRDFVTAYNKANITARQLSAQKTLQKVAQKSPAVSGQEIPSARSAELSLRRSLNETEANAGTTNVANATNAAAISNTTALRQIGITQQPDGSLAIDTKKFDAALQNDASTVRSVLTKVSQSVGRTAGQEVSDTGNIGRTTNAFNERTRSQESEQTQQLAQAASTRQTITEQAEKIKDRSLAGGAEAYQRMFSA